MLSELLKTKGLKGEGDLDRCKQVIDELGEDGVVELFQLAPNEK